IELEVRNPDDTIAFVKSMASGTFITIPANTLSTGENFTANLRFIHNVDSNTSSVPGVTGGAGYANDTQFSISTGGAGGGGGDATDPPLLAFTLPGNGQTGVAVTTPVNFLFSEAM